MYCIICAICITLPLYVALNIGWGLVMLFAGPKIENTDAEDQVLDGGGAFAERS